MAAALLFVVALVLPFEAPVFEVGPLVITTAELAIYSLLAVWGAAVALEILRAGSTSWARIGRRARAVVAWAGGEPMGRAVALWFAVLVVSALVAPAHRTSALKFALRTLGGVLLFFAARDLLRWPGLARRVALALVAGAVVSAIAALVDSALPEATELWEPFRIGAFTTLGLPRAAGTFAYPTIAAMYWEAAIPLLVVAPFGGGRGLDRVRPWIASALVTLVAGILVAAILLSATRTALVGAAVGSATMLVLAWRAGARVRRSAAGALAVTLVFVGITLVPGKGESLLSQRLQWWRDGTWFGVHYGVSRSPLTLTAGALVGLPVTVQNTGTLAWPQAGNDAVHLSYHWETTGPDGKPLLDFEGQRTRLRQDVRPGGTVRLLGVVRAPSTPGHYRLRWDMVRENITWFSGRGIPTADQIVEVVPGPRASRQEEELLLLSLEDWVTPATPSRMDLWRAAIRLWRRHPLLGVGPDNFRHLYPEVITPAREGRRFEDDRMHANNFYLETLADLGLAGLIALGLIVFALLRALRGHAALVRAGRTKESVLALACAVGAGTFFLHGLLDYFLEFTPAYGLYWLLLALAAGGWRPALAHSASPDSRR